MELSAALEALFAQAFEAQSALSEASPFQARHAAEALLDEAMLAAGFPRHEKLTPEGFPSPWTDRQVHRAASLTETQRAVAIFLSRRPGFPAFRYPLPGSPWAIRRWLGIDAPGVLFEVRDDGLTPYEGLRASRGERALQAYLATLPWRDRVQALADLYLITSDCPSLPTTVHALLPEIDDSLGDWALARAQLLVDKQTRDPLPAHVAETVLPLVYVALAHAGLSSSPEFDSLLQLSRWFGVSDAWLTGAQCALLNAIPEARREAALLASMSNIMFVAEQVRALERLLPFFPYPAVAAFILEHAHEKRYPLDALEAVRDVAATHPAIAEHYEAHMAAIGSIPTLRAVSFTPNPSRSALTPSQQDQLEEIARGWKLSVEQLLAANAENGHALSLIVIEGKEGAAFDAWVNEVHDGDIFRSGTAERVAWMSQGIPECDDKALLAALREALAGRHLDAMREGSLSGEPR